jgi:hypothetical protein
VPLHDPCILLKFSTDRSKAPAYTSDTDDEAEAEREQSLLRRAKVIKRFARATLDAPENRPKYPTDEEIKAFEEFPSVWNRWQQTLPIFEKAQAMHRDYTQNRDQNASEQHASQAPRVTLRADHALPQNEHSTSRKRIRLSSPAPQSIMQQDIPEKMTVAERARNDVAAGSLMNHPQNDVEPDHRPGGRLPFPKVEFKRAIEDCPAYPLRKDNRKINDMLSRPWLLGLAQDECQKICYGVYFVNHRSAACPYISTPDRCRNSHSLHQGVIDFVVTRRGVSHKVIQNMVESIKISGASAFVPPIKVPNAPSSVAPTPAQRREAFTGNTALPRIKRED